MPIQLRNTSLSLDINEPGEFYRGARFDWTGQIIQITYKDKYTFCTTETKDTKIVDKRGRGLYNEFGIDKPVGYDECPVGGQFPKIGVGLLTKESEAPYDFFHDYKISPHPFSYKVEENKAEFCCATGSDIDDYAFKLQKTIELQDESFTIYYRLNNLGKKTISTNEYVHNFLAISGREINEDYELSFPFKIERDRINKIVNPDGVVDIKDNSLTWNSTPNGEFFFDSLNTLYSGIGNWKLIHKREKVGIEEITNFNISKINLWGSPHVVSPEIFFTVNAAPGEQLFWSRTYKIFTIDNY